MGKLFLVGTPIGNLGDFSPRGVETLKSVDFIAAEDTRVTLKLLNRFDISKSMISYHEHNLRQKGQIIIERILSGESCALVTDAGMPAVSDPGEDLVRLAATAGIEVIVIPGPSAAVTALAMSGLSTERFCFEGFLSTNKAGRKEHLDSVADEKRTMIFYEAPHKLISTLKDMKSVFGGDRKIALCREITKLYEEAIRTTIDQAIELYESKSPKGEYVIVVEGNLKSTIKQVPIDDAAKLAKALTESGMAPSQAAKEAAKTTGCKRSEIYKALNF